MKTILCSVWLMTIFVASVTASVGFKKQSPTSLLKKAPKERMLADSQQMLDAQDSRRLSFNPKNESTLPCLRSFL